MEFTDLIELEKKLMDPLSRKDANLVGKLLDESFVEFGSSGKVYDRRSVLDRLSQEKPFTSEAFDFVPIELAKNIVQLRFKTRIRNEDGSLTTALRSSIWKRDGETWRMVFHQGTRASL